MTMLWHTIAKLYLLKVSPQTFQKHTHRIFIVHNLRPQVALHHSLFCATHAQRFSDILSDVPSGMSSDIDSDIASDIKADVTSDILFDV